MAELFENVFNKATVYETLFFSIKAVLIHPTLEHLRTNNQLLYECWQHVSKSKYDADPNKVSIEFLEETYANHAPHYPEFTKIIATTYGWLTYENGEQKRTLKKIVNEDEFVVIEMFMDVLHQLSSEGAKASPQYFPSLCGYNLINHEIPLLIKRFLTYQDKFDINKRLPHILKKYLFTKPWDVGVIDIANVWKFSGLNTSPFQLITDFLGLKRTVNLLPLPELSKYYWENVTEKPNETLEYVALQSATQTNLAILFMNELRRL